MKSRRVPVTPKLASARRVTRPDEVQTAFLHASPDCKWAWAAGLFEAEGWFGTSNKGRTGRLVLAPVDFDTVQRFRDIVQCGYIAPVQRPNKQRCFYWSLNYSDDICQVIPHLLPWLGRSPRGSSREDVRGRHERAR